MFVDLLRADNIPRVHDVLEVLDALGPDAVKEDTIAGRLVALLQGASDHEATEVAYHLAKREPAARHRDAAVDRLLLLIDNTAEESRSGLLQRVAALQPEGERHEAAVAAAVEHLGRKTALLDADVEPLLQLGGLDADARRRALTAILGALTPTRFAVTDRILDALIALGLDAPALAGFAERHGGSGSNEIEAIVRRLAAALRRRSDAETWQAIVPTLETASRELYR